MAVAQACSSQHISKPKLAENEHTPLSKEAGKEAGVATNPWLEQDEKSPPSPPPPGLK